MGLITTILFLDPGIGFGKNLEHNMTIIKKIYQIYHSLGLPVILGLSRKRFIKELSDKNDSSSRIGGTVSSSICNDARCSNIKNDVNEVKQSIKVFRELTK